jgi:diaminohydroxyphosphoribosylaminopyrimidine deaminase/5-amino-6-(5-phosphoribosylamino)uracil reductase
MLNHVEMMRVAIAAAEHARGHTGDNPWVGCAIVARDGTVLASGCTQGPGEDHAEIVAMRQLRAQGVDLTQTVMYSTLEPCSFHGRTPACARAIASAGFRTVVTGIRDPNPKVDGVGVQILRDGGIEVIEDVCAVEIAHQLAPWIFKHHPHEPLRRARALCAQHMTDAAVSEALCAYYGIDSQAALELVARARQA